MPRTSFTTLPSTPRTGDLPVTELWTRCNAAASLAMKGKSYSPEDRAECAAEIAAKHWSAAKLAGATVTTMTPRRIMVGGDGASGAVTYSGKRQAKSIDAPRVEILPTDAIRNDHAPSFGTLYGEARNLRRSLDRRRATEADHAAREAAENFAASIVIADDPEDVRSTPEDARDRAIEMLSALGLPRLGKCFPVAYRAARAATETGADIIARELHTTVPALDMAQSRARKRIPSLNAHGRAAHADALHLPDGGIALKPTRTRTESADLGATDWRCKPETVAPVTVRTDRRLIRKNDRKPDWTRGLSATADARLAKAAELRRARRDAENVAERDAL